jgi:hypothetical protein
MSISEAVRKGGFPGSENVNHVGKKFRAETTALPIVVVRGGPMILSPEFFGKACPIVYRKVDK